MTEIGKEYGTALFMLGCENGKKKEYSDALKLVEDAFAETPEYMDLLASPSIPMEERLTAIEKTFSSAVPEEVLSYLKLLCERNRIVCFHESAKEYRKLLDASEHVSNAKVTSAIELTKEEKTALTAKLEKLCQSSVTVQYFIDESLIGGIIVEIDGKVLDGSLRRRLNEVKDVISR